MKALILAGGEGKRLRPLTNDKPKPLIEVGGKPIIEWQIEWMKRYGVDCFIISAGYMKERLIEYLGTGAKFRTEINFVVENEPLGTAGAIKNAIDILRKEEKFVVANGDIITNLDLGRLISANKTECTISLVPFKSPFGIVDTEGEVVVGFREKPLIKDHWISAGIYVMSKSVFDYLPEKGSVELETFPKLAVERKIENLKFSDVYWKSVDSFKDFDDVNFALSNNLVYT